MKFVHGGSIKKKISASAIVRIVFGSIIFIASFVLLILALSGVMDDPTPIVVCNCVFLWPASILLLVLGIRALLNSLGVFHRHDISVMLSCDINNPYYTCQCESCGLVFDYQQSDLGFRAWYPSGYVECPRCESPIRHNAIVNTFRVDEHIY